MDGPVRVIVCGGRDYSDRKAVIKALMGLPRGTIVVGDVPLAEDVWESWGGTVEHGQKMVGAKYCIAFPGDQVTVARAEKAKIQVKRVK